MINLLYSIIQQCLKVHCARKVMRLVGNDGVSTHGTFIVRRKLTGRRRWSFPK